MSVSNNICHWEDDKLVRCSNNKVKVIKDPFCRHCGADLRKPSKIEIGVFGKFYDSPKKFTYGFLASLDDDLYVDQLGDYWENFEMGLPLGINPDGSVGK